MNCNRELRELLHPISPDTFFAEYWERKPLFIKGGAEKIERLIPGGFGPTHFFEAIRKAEANAVRGFRLWAQKLKERNVYIRSEQIDAMIADGNNIATELPTDHRVARLVTALKAQLRHAGDVSYAATLSPAGHGWPLHIDRSINLSIQCEGKKLFVVSEEPVLQWPTGSVSFTDDGLPETFLYNPLPWEEAMRADTSRLLEFEAEPGDVIYWPAGTLHTTRALSDLSLTLHSALNHETFLNLFSRFLLSTFTLRPEWRHLPAIPAVAATPGQLPAEVKEFFAARLQEMVEFVGTLNADSMDFNREWHKVLAAPGELILPQLLPVRPEDEARTIEPGDVFRLSRTAPITFTFGMNSESERIFYLYFADKELSVTSEWFDFLNTLVRQDRFVAESATRWAQNGRPYDWETVRAYLQMMFEQGVIERESSAVAARV
jgi:hypothetical protein